MRKQISRRHWKKRWLDGLWLPTVVVQAYKLSAPDGYVEQAHPEERGFWRIVRADDCHAVIVKTVDMPLFK